MTSNSSNGRKQWTPDRIIEEIQRIEVLHDDLSYTAMCERGQAGLYAAARKTFGSWKHAVIAAGVPLHRADRQFHKERWTKEKVIARIQYSRLLSLAVRSHHQLFVGC